eukprot:Lithocolla_globosa_v1_NODE_557_length_3753_cov_135.321796.p2 type:complete len:303 gc:universal NODE_557_length_3753_cov_135.321796:1708-2616(+)
MPKERKKAKERKKESGGRWSEKQSRKLATLKVYGADEEDIRQRYFNKISRDKFHTKWLATGDSDHIPPPPPKPMSKGARTMAIFAPEAGYSAKQQKEMARQARFLDATGGDGFGIPPPPAYKQTVAPWDSSESSDSSSEDDVTTTGFKRKAAVSPQKAQTVMRPEAKVMAIKVEETIMTAITIQLDPTQEQLQRKQNHEGEVLMAVLSPGENYTLAFEENSIEPTICTITATPKQPKIQDLNESFRVRVPPWANVVLEPKSLAVDYSDTPIIPSNIRKIDDENFFGFVADANPTGKQAFTLK